MKWAHLENNTQIEQKKSWKSLEIGFLKLTTHIIIWRFFQTCLFLYMPQYMFCVWFFKINMMIFFSQAFLVTTTLNGWMCTIIKQTPMEWIDYFLIFNVINSTAVNSYMYISLCTFNFYQFLRSHNSNCVGNKSAIKIKTTFNQSFRKVVDSAIILHYGKL